MSGKKKFHVGDVVSLLPNATYYDGRIIPARIKKDQWIIAQIRDDRAVIDDNVRRSESICSPVHTKYLTLEKHSNRVGKEGSYDK